MSKAMLIMDMPESCEKCRINIDGFCPAVLEPCECVEGGEMWKETPKNRKADWCPLREVPEYKCENKELTQEDYFRVQGFNACIDEIMGGEYEK